MNNPAPAATRTPFAVNQLRLVGVGGANKVMAGELSRLVRRAYDDIRVPIPKKEGPGAVSYPFDLRMALLAARYHRTSARVLWELYRCPAQRLEPLFEQLRRAVSEDPRAWYWDGATLSVEALSVRDFAAGERQVVGTVKNAIVEAAAERGASLRVEPRAPDLPVDVRLIGSEVSIALDLAGMPMHRRGYRQLSGVAPLREDLAALIVMLARHDSRSEPLLDPMAGSGTLGIEAVGLGQGRPVWCSGRRPRAENWPQFAELAANKAKPIFGDTSPFVIANEADDASLEMMKRNIETAGCASQIAVRGGDFRELGWSSVAALCSERGLSAERGLILCNPPYGHRLEDEAKVEGLYRELAEWCRGFSGWRAGFVVAHPRFEALMRGRPRIIKPVRNGPLDATFYLYDL